jgi:hypothetical protein
VRLVVDRLIPGNVLVGAWPDRIAGGAVGLVTGMIAVGVFTIGIQLLPTGPRWLMYRPFDDGLKRQQSLAPFYPDEFTLGLIDILSAGSIRGNTKFSERHDNLLLEAWCARNEANQLRTVDNEKVVDRIGRMDAPPDCLVSLDAYEPNDPAWKADVPPDPLMVEGDPSRILIVRVKVSDPAKGGNQVKDTDSWWRLPATQFRLAVHRSKTDSNLTNHYPVAYMTAYLSDRDYSGTVTRGTTPDWKPIAPPRERENGQFLPGQLYLERPGKKEGGADQLVMDWVFRIGRDEEPQYVAFRRVARLDLPAAIKPGLPDPKDALDRTNKQR